MLYMSHVVTTVAASRSSAPPHSIFANPGYLDDTIVYMNMKPLFDDPVRGFIGIVVLGHQLGYFNILPMYMGILAMLPVIMWLARRSLKLLLALLDRAVAPLRLFVIDMPNYPMEGGWFFNPFAWQLLFVIGFILGQRAARGKAMPCPWLFWVSAAYLVLAVIWLPFDWRYHSYMPVCRRPVGFRQDLCRLPAPLACAGARLCGDDVAASANG